MWFTQNKRQIHVKHFFKAQDKQKCHFKLLSIERQSSWRHKNQGLFHDEAQSEHDDFFLSEVC